VANEKAAPKPASLKRPVSGFFLADSSEKFRPKKGKCSENWKFRFRNNLQTLFRNAFSGFGGLQLRFVPFPTLSNQNRHCILSIQMSHQLLDSISEEDGENLLPPHEEVDPLKVAKALSRDINSLVMQLELSPADQPSLDQFSKEGELLKQASKSQHCELVWAEVRSDILSFYTGVRST
jgi:hypothetical protein